MRRNRPFPPALIQSQPEPEPPPTRLGVLQQRLGRFYARFRNVFLVTVGILITLGALFLYNTIQPQPQPLTQRNIDTAVEEALASAKPKPSYASQAYEIIHPSLVRVETMVLEEEDKTEGSIGTGVVITDGGIILTSLHVIKDAVEVHVIFADGTESEVSVIVKQPENDLAVLRPYVVPDDLVPATLTSSNTLRIGDEVFAAGNPFGIGNSLTAGVVSGLKRSFKSPKTGEILTNLIQFDAAVNPGNSGGPLVNRNGEVVGIVTALLNPTDQDVFIGIGFAVPMETAAAAAGPSPY